ncbi:MAG TPA: carbamoyltransferase C-terminal domain-containing protein, partial [Chryseolinea sp.]|nr:carbamoyltransferase C-terminal domain-containing protein [Chryseolinea sp.]
MYTLGINASFHDSSACLVQDGKLIAAAEEERFTHIKHGKRPIPFSTYELPFHAIDYCLKTAGLHINDVDNFAYAFDPYQLLDKTDEEFIKLPFHPKNITKDQLHQSPWDPLFLASIINAPDHLADGWPHHLQKRFLGAKIDIEKWHFVDHHLSHAVSAFHASPYDNAAVMTLDGRGEKATTAYYVGKGNELTRISQVNMPHSLGLLYERVTTHLGFLHSSDEYKVMALASYGKPVFLDVFRSMIHVGDRGTYVIDDCDLTDVLGPVRKRGDEFLQVHFDIAHSLQAVLQETVLTLSQWLYNETKAENLCLAGGVALNCVSNSFLRDNGPFKNIWVQPAAGDAGTALGAALWIDIQKTKSDVRHFVMDHAYWGPEYSDEEIETFLKWAKIPYRRMNNIAKESAELLAQNKIIGWFQGRMEFGPRALGSRSILASPIDAAMQARLNVVKDREDFRPVAPVVLEEDAHDWFENATYSPFMLFVFNVKEGKSEYIPAVRHVDGTARIQTINEHQNPIYYNLLKEFKKITGVPVLVNTSFNTLGKPIVCSPRDAIECFWT